HHEVAGEAAGGFDNDCARAVAGDLGQQGSEAGPRLDWIGTGHRRVVELANQSVAVAPDKALNGAALAGFAVLAFADIGGARRSQIGNRLYQLASISRGFLHGSALHLYT